MSNPTILEVLPGSPAAAAGLAAGDELLAVNGIAPTDVIEYQQLADDADPTLMIRRAGGDAAITVAKPEGEPLGLRLSSSVFDRVQTCDNHCEFCFIYQLPPGMRKSLYLKDDDYRLSFLYGNFTTLTRFTELDLARVVEERLGPLYVSIHATDPDVRTAMLRNPRGATSLRWLRALLDHDIEVHGQVVLCPTVNGGEVLHRTCAEVIARYPKLASMGIVPLGISRFAREITLTPHTKDEAVRDLEIIHFWQQVALEQLGRRIFHASDELYLMAGIPFPESDAYEGFAQHENGIGMVRALYDEVERLERGTDPDRPLITGEWRSIPAAPDEGYRAPRHLAGAAEAPDRRGPAVIVTGTYGAQVIEPIRSRLESLAGRRMRILPVRNDFFRGNVAVAGLMVGADIRRAFEADRGEAGVYLIPDVAVQSDVFLDDLTIADVAAAAGAPVRIVEATAAGLLHGATESGGRVA
jgi:putative radical SAM enzyme (TIGR03279 family)